MKRKEENGKEIGKKGEGYLKEREERKPTKK